MIESLNEPNPESRDCSKPVAAGINSASCVDMPCASRSVASFKSASMEQNGCCSTVSLDHAVDQLSGVTMRFDRECALNISYDKTLELINFKLNGPLLKWNFYALLLKRNIVELLMFSVLDVVAW